ncbi:beta-lactamase family protein [Talaromyces proteolyticus]|uniref:Beta-lactamase family protein n=1 Tax=Talaromyces proteolyticus TaxID=1131652 RepID=A0AAD4PXL0_9EURO|nr:beta-lactamase family protein [Talaromyces proteolyticus]KAH8700190.1 beta-lactamase family protein [Talaromyces proteolyticus]
MPAIPSPHFPAGIQTSLRQHLDKATSGTSPAVAGLVYSAVNRDGEIIFNHASGAKGLGIADPMTLDTVFWMASCTKMITGIACMQLVEQGKLVLDDGRQVETIAPELRDVKVLEGDLKTGFRLVEKTRPITLRMLLNHTAGFPYPFDDPRLRDYSLPIGFDEFAGNTDDVLGLPLVNQPGTKFQYGVNIDWAGVLLERVTGLSLDQYFQKHIFEPLGVKDIAFFPTRDMKKRLAYMHRREKDGSLHLSDHLYRFPLAERRTGQPEDRFCSGGAGCFGTPVEYCKIIAVLLNNGTCPRTKSRILKPETVDEMFKDQIPNLPRYRNTPSESAKPHLANHGPVRPATDDTETEGWGLTFSINHRKWATGRPAGTVNWEGIANLFWFADRDTGVGGMIASQIMPYGDLAVLETNDAVETGLYQGLAQQAHH